MRHFIDLVESAGRESVPAAFFCGTPMYRWQQIRHEGLVPSSASHPGAAPGVYLTHQIGVAVHYAEMNFGEDQPQEWAILRIEGAAIDPTLLRPDTGHETQMAMRDIMAHGFTEDQVREGKFPWWISLEETGQVVYGGAIPPSAIRLERTVG
jgi:hypothetical protein